jgi:hypothetical protein
MEAAGCVPVLVGVGTTMGVARHESTGGGTVRAPAPRQHLLDNSTAEGRRTVPRDV